MDSYIKSSKSSPSLCQVEKQKGISTSNDNEGFIVENLEKLILEYIPLISQKRVFNELNPNQKKSLSQIIETTYDRMQRGTRAMAKINWSRNIQVADDKQRQLHFTQEYKNLDQLSNVVIQAVNNLALLALESRVLDQANTKSSSVINKFQDAIDKLNSTGKFSKLTLALVLTSNFWSFYSIKPESVSKHQFFNTKSAGYSNLKLDKQDLEELQESFTKLPSLFNSIKGDFSVTIPAFQVIIAAFHNRKTLEEGEYDFDLKNHLDNLENLLRKFQTNIAEEHKEVISEALTQWYATFAVRANENDHEGFVKMYRIIQEHRKVFLQAIEMTEKRHEKYDLSLLKCFMDFPGSAIHLMPKNIAFEDILLKPHSCLDQESIVMKVFPIFLESLLSALDFAESRDQFAAMKAKLQSS